MLTSSQLQATFKAFGKFIKLGQLADDYTATLKLHQMATADQVTEASADSYPIFRGVVLPLELSVGRTIASVESVPLRAQQALENYLRMLADDLGVSATATAAAKLSALKTSMIDAEETVAPSGSFYNYVNERWGVVLPSAEPPTMPDAWITTAIV